MTISLSLAIGLLTTLVSAVLAGEVLWRWWHKRSAHLLLWGVGLLLYVLAGVCEVILSFGWSALAFRLWYWSGALMIPPILGQGTMHLLVRRKGVAIGFTLAVVFAAYASLAWVLSVQLDAAQFRPDGDIARFLTESYRAILPASPIRKVLPPILNGYGTLLLAGGAVYSAALFLRKQVLPNRVIGNVFIAVGGLLPALGGTLVKLAEDYSALSGLGAAVKYVAILLGVLVMWVGFRWSAR